MSIVLKQFPWSPNGYDVEILNAGDERNFGDALVGLVAAGFVEEAEAPLETSEDDKSDGAETQPVVFPLAATPAPKNKTARKGK